MVGAVCRHVDGERRAWWGVQAVNTWRSCGSTISKQAYKVR